MEKMNPFKKFFIGKVLSLSDDPFDNVRYEVLLNFSMFLLLVNIPYTVLALHSHPIHSISAWVQNSCMITVAYILRKATNPKLAIYIFMGNFISQNILHFLINNGILLDQGIMFYTTFVTITFILLGRKWGLGVTVMVVCLIIVGTYNSNNNFALFEFAPELADPTKGPEIGYIIILPLLMNIYLVSEFVKAQNKARELLNEQKKLVTEKNREILDSIHYAKRIQNSLLPTEKYIHKKLSSVGQN